MKRLIVHVEGQTEESFVNEVLRDYLVEKGYHSVEARIVGNARLRRRRGGIRPWPSVRTDIVNHLLQDPGCIATTIIDYYGLPDDWPGKALAGTFGTAADKARRVEDAIGRDVGMVIGDRNPSRFVPFVVMHEFEGLLFSDCAAFSRAVNQPQLLQALREIRYEFATPEDINDSPETAPSKRLQALVPGYQKPLFGVLAILEMGLAPIRAECPHFDRWLLTLESLVD
jgi:hypothetical protein